MGAELESPRFARFWLSAESGEALFASWRLNPARTDDPLQMNVNHPDELLGWVNFIAESRGKAGDLDVVLRYYAADGDTDPETVRGFMENAAPAPPSGSGKQKEN